jgi:hypothetical protein
MFLIMALVLGACYIFEPPPVVTLTPPGTPATPIPLLPTPTDLPFPWSNENATVGGICFEAALDSAGRVFVLRSADDHIRFYDLADGSGLCRRPVNRLPFDFSAGRILVGLWSAGVGCLAFHEVADVLRDDAALTFTVRLRFITQGECSYELVRPFWIGFDGMSDFDIRIGVD